MKKLLLLLFLLIIPFKVNAEISDTTPPTIKSFKLNTPTVEEKTSINVTLDVEDDVSGVYTLQFRYVKNEYKTNGFEDGNVYLFTISNLNNGENTRTIDLPNEMKSGEYIFQAIYLTDWNFNTIYYRNIDEQINGALNWERLPFTINQNLTVTKSNKDTAGPLMSNFKLSKNEVNIGESFNLTLNAEDLSGIESIWFNLDSSSYSCQSTGGNNYLCPIKIKKPGEYHILEISAMDKEKNTSKYVVPGFPNKNDADIHYELPVLYIKVTGEIEKIAPKLKNITFSTKSINIPGSMKAYIEYEDNNPKDLYRYNFIIYNKKTNKPSTIFLSSNYIDDYKIEYNIECSQYVEPGEYYVHEVYLEDEAGNVNEYKYGENLNYYSFVVNNQMNSTDSTSTTSSNMFEVIENASDDAVIGIDSSKSKIIKKNAFDAIKGTNKTIFIESSGIQWIFKGTDIINETKDIDTTVIFYTLNDNESNDFSEQLKDNPSLVINFPSNGKLPGKCKIRIKADYALKNYLGLKELYVYYYNTDEKMFSTVATKIELNSEGYYEFYITHNSTFVLTKNSIDQKYVSKIHDEVYEINNLSEKEDSINFDNTIIVDNKIEEPKEENINKKSDNNLILIYGLIFIIITIILAVIIFIYKNKKIKKHCKNIIKIIKIKLKNIIKK